jgi:protein arginine kinase
MSMAELPDHAGHWLRGEGPQSDLVVSSRIRLARNLAGFPFVHRASRTQREEILHRCRTILVDDGREPPLHWINIPESPPLDRQLLVERHLMSRQHAKGGAEMPRAVAFTGDERVAVMVNEEDHLRLSVLRSGMQIDEAYRELDRLDDALEAKLEMAYSDRWGYLTACPTNVGTGLRVSVMLHLPALRLTGEIDKVRRAARDMNLAVRGLFGEGSEALGDLYQVSNQVTLGCAEREVVADFQHTVVPQIIAYEQQARSALLKQRIGQLDDKVWRAWAVLTHARVLGTEESLSLLSHLRMGVYMGRIDRIDIRTINELFLLTQPAHLQKMAGCEMNPAVRREARAHLVRQRLGAA